MKKIYTQLEKAKQEFAEYKKTELNRIELSLVDDAKKILKAGKDLNKKLISAYKPYKKIEAEYGKVYAKILDFLDDTKGMVEDGEQIQKEANDMYDKLEKGAKDLGTDVGDIPVAFELDEIAVELGDSINDIRNARRDASDV
tara:strand:+ start:446 stop:871 length:426 start_codon:yes stop_codon:yes gene_type:complete